MPGISNPQELEMARNWREQPFPPHEVRVNPARFLIVFRYDNRQSRELIDE